MENNRSNLDVIRSNTGVNSAKNSQPLYVKELINELNEKTKLRKQGESSELIAKLITTSTDKKLGNNILSIDNSKSKTRHYLVASSGGDRQTKLKRIEETTIKNGTTGQLEYGLNGATSSKQLNESIYLRGALNTASSAQLGTETILTAIQESSPQTVELKPQANNQSFFEKLSSSLSSNQQIDYAQPVRKEKRKLKKNFKFSIANKSIDTQLKSYLSDSRSNLSANQDRGVDTCLIVSNRVDPAELSNGLIRRVSSDSEKCDRAVSVNCRSTIDKTGALNYQSINHFKKTSTANNSPNPSHHSQIDTIHLRGENSSSSNSTILPVSQSSSKSSFDSAVNHHTNYSQTKTENHLLSEAIKLSSTADNNQFDLIKTLQPTNSSDRKSIKLRTFLNDDHQVTKTVSTNNQSIDSKKSKITITNSTKKRCSNCGDHLQTIKQTSMSNGSNSKNQAAMQNADAYLSQLSAQQLNQLIMDQAFIPQHNASNSTHSNSLSNHGNGTVHDSESSEQFRRLLCRKCRPNRTGIVQHSHNSNTKFARNLHQSAMNVNPRWNLLKEYSKNSIKRLKRHQKRLSGYARAMRKQYNNHSPGSGTGGVTTGGDLSGDNQQAAFANMVLNAINTNKQLNSSNNFCKECYFEKMLAHQNSGLINGDYQKNSVCMSCVNMNNALSMLNAQWNYDLPPLTQNQKIGSSEFVDSAFVDRFFDVEQWRNKLRKERLQKKERNVLMIVSSIAIIVFAAISYFGTILFLRLTRLQNEGQ